ncbi:hypothetical protein G6F65_020107 [Rhizopus arrhizus]|nr:hypothetical protein G6F65_020107 [Rhizopus arrhizus]
MESARALGADLPHPVRRRARFRAGWADHCAGGGAGPQPAGGGRRPARAGGRRHAQPGQPLPFLDLPRAAGRELHHPHAPAACVYVVDDGPAVGRRAHGRDSVSQRLRAPEGMAGPAHRRPGRRDHFSGAGRQALHPAGQPWISSRGILRGRGAVPVGADRTRGPQSVAGRRRLRRGKTGE